MTPDPVTVTEERVANITADIASIIEDLEEFAKPSFIRADALAALEQARFYAAAALRLGPP